jgi:hypothetical protein
MEPPVACAPDLSVKAKVSIKQKTTTMIIGFLEALVDTIFSTGGFVPSAKEFVEVCPVPCGCCKNLTTKSSKCNTLVTSEADHCRVLA